MAAERSLKLQRLRAIMEEFQAELPQRLDELHQAWEAAKAGDFEGFSPEGTLRRRAHSLAGSAGTFGFKHLGLKARALEENILALGASQAVAPEALEVGEGLLAELSELATLGIEGGATEEALSPPPAMAPPVVDLVYVLEDDALLAQEIAGQLRHFGYQARDYTTTAQLRQACEEQLPAVLVADISLAEGSLEGPRMALELQNLSPRPIPVIFVSQHNRWDAHLSAIRAGGKAYLPKPLDFTALVAQLDRLAGRIQEKPYRVLVVEDDPLQAAHFPSVLQGAGMEVEALLEPSGLMARLDTFSPDVVLMDVFLTGCTGIEVTQVVRQDPRNAHVPIVFLSSLQSREEQLAALAFGADDFLQKPIPDAQLVGAITARARRFRALGSLMNRDGLTGLLNHINLKLALARELAQVQRRHGTLSFVMVDIDHFKQVNDAYGHPAGDRVIKSLARLLSERLRKGDYAARYGGEEFAVVLSDTGAQGAFEVMEDLRLRFLALKHLHPSGTFHASFSAGIAVSPPHRDMDILIQAADKALYLAKHAGRNRVIVDPETPLPD